MTTSTGFIGYRSEDGEIIRYTPPTITIGAGSPSNPSITVPSTGTAVTASTVVPTGSYVFIATTGGAASLLTGNGTRTFPAAGFSYPAS